MSKSLIIISILFGSFQLLAQGNVIPGEYIVKVRRGVQLQQAFSSQAVRNVAKKAMPLGGYKSRIVRVKMKKGFEVSGANALASNHQFEYVEPVFKINTPKAFRSGKKAALTTPSDALFPKLWGLNNKKHGYDVEALKAWKHGKGSKKVVVAVIDTGVDYKHPDLAPNMWVNQAEANGKPGVDDDNNGYVDDIHGHSFTNYNRGGDPMDDHGHGTHCAGTIGAVHNAIGVAGVVSNVQIMAIKFLGKYGGTTADAIESIYYAVDNGAHILSNSWGGGGYSKALKEAIEYANAKGVVFTAAAGNDNVDNDKKPHYPSNYKVDNVISVAAYAEDGERAYVVRGGRKIVFSNYGIKTVHVAAPGSEILSTVLGGKYEAYSGTSMATPHVTGVVALLVSLNAREWVNRKGEARNMDINPKSVKDLLIKTSIKEESLSYMSQSGGRVSAANVMNTAVRALRR